MSRRRFHAPPEAFDESSVTLGFDEARHLRDVLRLGRGDEVYVFDGEGREFACAVEEQMRDSALLKIIEEVEPAQPESNLQLTLALALLKGEKFDLAVQKATELGVRSIVPVVTKHADVRLREGSADGEKRKTRWQRIALEAAKQSGRALVPKIYAPVDFNSLIEDAANDEQKRLMFSERDGLSLMETIGQWPSEPAKVSALVGSEGGWADEEIAQARSRGWHIITLGGRTLRAETAAITVVALLQHLFGDLK